MTMLMLVVQEDILLLHPTDMCELLSHDAFDARSYEAKIMG